MKTEKKNVIIIRAIELCVKHNNGSQYNICMHNITKANRILVSAHFSARLYSFLPLLYHYVAVPLPSLQSNFIICVATRV